MTPSRLAPLYPYALTLSLLVLGSACQGPGADAPLAPAAAPTVAGPTQCQGPDPMVGDAHQWEVVLPPPPAVLATLLERYHRDRGLRGGGMTTVYLNFEGQSITYSSTDSNSASNTSWIPGHNVTVPAFVNHWTSDGTRDQVIQAIVTRLNQIYTGFDIQFVTTRPTSGEYTMTVIGGTAALIGQQYGVLGVSPMDCCGTAQGCGPDTMNLNAADINFICTEDIANFGMNLWDLVFTIAHEDGHTFGLAHNNRNQDIMYWAESGGETAGGLTWGAGTTRSGEQNCSANNYQDDCIDLTKAIGGGCPGHETTPPTVTITSPANNATLPAGPVAVTVDASDASGVVKVEMYVDTALKSTLVASPWSFDLLGVSAGAHQLVAKATDLYGTVGTSAAVTVTVSAPQPQCTVDADCGPGKRCVTGTCVAAPQCVADADCGANQWCVNNKCVAPSCVADSDCPNGLTCVANTCQSSQPTGAVFGADCDLNTDCQSGMCVSGTQHYCTQTCNPASPCPTGYSCQSDVCIADGIPPGATGSPCTKNSDCRTGICVDGSGDGYCTEVCHTGGPACPNGGDCAVSGDGATYLCGPTPVVVTPSGNTSGGCAAAPVGPAPIAGAVALLGLLGLARRRRSGR